MGDGCLSSSADRPRIWYNERETGRKQANDYWCLKSANTFSYFQNQVTLSRHSVCSSRTGYRLSGPVALIGDKLLDLHAGPVIKHVRFNQLSCTTAGGHLVLCYWVLSGYRFPSLALQHPVTLINPPGLTTLKQLKLGPPETQTALLLSVPQSTRRKQHLFISNEQRMSKHNPVSQKSPL